MDEIARLTGIPTPPASAARLKAGRLACEFVDGGLSTIAWGGVEMIRAVAYLVRDRDWVTLAPAISELAVEEDGEGFRIAYTARMAEGGATLTVEARIEAGDGRLRFEAVATPDRDFATNRTGFIVLHPVEASGLPLVIEHSAGDRTVSSLPELVDPWQPFMDIVALTHVAGEITCRCEFAGDVFEMEDQRNWTDASFKTYVRPLALPWPYVLPAGVAARQAVTLAFSGEAAHPTRADAGVTVAVDRSRTFLLPALALVLPPEQARAAAAQPGALVEIAPDRLTAHFDPAAGHGAEDIAALAALHDVFGGPIDLEYAARCDGDLDEEFSALAEMLGEAGLRPSSVLVCPAVDRRSTPPGSAWPACPPLADVYAAARRALGEVPVGGGMLSYFTELNRKRPPLTKIDFVQFGTNPLIHAADDASVMQTLSALPFIMRSAVAIAGSRMLRLGLSSIPMRQNPYGSRTMPNPRGERLTMADSDPRHLAPFGAAYTLGYLAAIAPYGAHAFTPAELFGPRGVRTDAGPTPLGALAARLAPLAGREAHPVTVSVPNRVAALALADGTLLANLTPQEQQVTLDGERLSLRPYAIDRR